MLKSKIFKDNFKVFIEYAASKTRIRKRLPGYSTTKMELTDILNTLQQGFDVSAKLAYTSRNAGCTCKQIKYFKIMLKEL